MTKLLVSPKNLGEARTVSESDVDIIDVKNPKEGSLGANFPWIISKIREKTPSETPISAAIGDFPNLPGSASLAALGALKAGADIIKVGLKGPSNPDEASFLMNQVVRSVKENSDSAEVVACAYGDFERADTINPLALPTMGQIAQTDYVMLDTAVKDGKPLTDFLTIKQLRSFVNEAHSIGLKVALAGSLGKEEIRELKELNPEVIGVRGAVCEDQDRDQGISAERIQELKKILED